MNNDVDWIAEIDNSGPDDAHNVVATFTIPSGLIVYGFDTRSIGNATYNPNTGIITWNVGTMPNNSGIAMDVFCHINQSGSITTNFNITHSQEYDPDLSNNNQSATLTIPAEVDVQVNQTVNGLQNTTATVGSIVTYVVSVANNGPNNATGVSIIESTTIRINFHISDLDSRKLQ